MKICSSCERSYQEGYKSFCRSCYVKLWQKRNPEKFKSYVKKHNKKVNNKYQKNWNKLHPESIVQRQAKYRKTEKCKIKMKRWRNNHPERNAYDTAQRRKAVKRATPSWASKEALKNIYFNRPKGFHVDHIIPLQGEFFCGLHVPWNLQYLSPRDNSSKKNKLLPNHSVTAQNRSSEVING